MLVLQHLLADEGGPVGLSLRAAGANEEQLLSSLRGLRSPRYSHELPLGTLSEAINRLQVANIEQTVVLVVDLDALDEAEPALWSQLSRLIKTWLDQGYLGLAAKLIVSSRPRTRNRRGKLGLIREWLGVEYPEVFVDRVGFVEVTDFDANELTEAASRLGGEPETRLLQGTPLATAQSARTLNGNIDSGFAPTSIVDSLRHPVVWGVYASLLPQERNAVLDDLPHGTDRLADLFVERFLSKCRVRRHHRTHEDHLETALRSVAVASVAASAPYARESVWDAGCVRLLGRENADFLYNEALSYGLIEEDEPSTWRWRHSFVSRSLSRGGS